MVVPLANEQNTIETLLAGVLEHLDSGDRIYCVLDNVSRDGTRGLVEEHGQRDERVRLVWAPENRCVVDAYFRGYREAMDDECEWILEMDGGLSHAPAEIPRFLDAMARGASFVAGSRFMSGSDMQTTPWRFVVSRGGTILANLMLGTRMRDMTSGFECFTRAALQRVLDRGVRSRAHFFQTEIRYLMHELNWVEVPISYRNPSSSIGSANLGEALRNLLILRREARRA